MCMSVRPSEMSNTKIYVGDAMHKGKYVHVLAYQNNAKTNEPNAMVLPIFTKEKVTKKNVLDTTSYKDLFNTIFAEPALRGMKLGMSKTQVFTSGSYTIVLAANINKAADALSKVPENKRPKLGAKFIEFFDKLYSEYPVAICCWDGSVSPEPLLWWYEPIEKDVLMVPTMDSHDGESIDLNAQVKMDHYIAVGSAITKLHGGREVSIKKDLMPISVKTVKIKGNYVNGDCMVSLDSLKNNEVARLYKPYRQNCKIAQNYFDLKK